MESNEIQVFSCDFVFVSLAFFMPIKLQYSNDVYLLRWNFRFLENATLFCGISILLASKFSPK